tara:strand:+ start:907 stop:1413 length:507 start_codon:yes stop_codon:yes gene_type:complete
MSAVLKSEVLNIRAIQESDFPSILEIEQASYNFPWSERIFLDCVAAGYHCRLLLKGEDVAGYCIVAYAAEEVHILNICVGPEYRRKGCARLLIENEISKGAKSSVKEIYLEVRVSNIGAICLYKGLGFKNVGIRKDYYPTESGREDAYVFRLLLEDFELGFSGLNLYV